MHTHKRNAKNRPHPQVKDNFKKANGEKEKEAPCSSAVPYNVSQGLEPTSHAHTTTTRTWFRAKTARAGGRGRGE